MHICGVFNLQIMLHMQYVTEGCNLKQTMVLNISFMDVWDIDLQNK